MLWSVVAHSSACTHHQWQDFPVLVSVLQSGKPQPNCHQAPTPNQGLKLQHAWYEWCTAHLLHQSLGAVPPSWLCKELYHRPSQASLLGKPSHMIDTTATMERNACTCYRSRIPAAQQSLRRRWRPS